MNEEPNHELLATCLRDKQQGMMLVSVPHLGIVQQLRRWLRDEAKVEWREVLYGHVARTADGLLLRHFVIKALQAAEDGQQAVWLVPEVPPDEVVPEDAPAVNPQFWKTFNFYREMLGRAQSLIVLFLTDEHQPMAYSYTLDLLSWCAPKLDIRTVPAPANEAARWQPIETTAAELRPAPSPKDLKEADRRWRSLSPLFVMAPKPLDESKVDTILIPLLQVGAELRRFTEVDRLLAAAQVDPAKLSPKTRVEFQLARAKVLSAIPLYAEATILLRETLAFAETHLGPDHRLTLAAMNNLASSLHDQGHYSEARPLFERALAGRERVLGPEHPDTLSSVNNLASLLESQGDYAGAAPLYERALAASERILGPEDPDSLASMNNLALLLKSQGDYARAAPLYERALAACERVLGPEHPDTLTSVNNLASLLESQGDYAGARPLYERALEARERILGPEHPDTLISTHNLALFLVKTGEQKRARQLASEYLLRIPDNWQHTVAIRTNLQAILDAPTIAES